MGKEHGQVALYPGFFGHPQGIGPIAVEFKNSFEQNETPRNVGFQNERTPILCAGRDYYLALHIFSSISIYLWKKTALLFCQISTHDFQLVRFVHIHSGFGPRPNDGFALNANPLTNAFYHVIKR